MNLRVPFWRHTEEKIVLSVLMKKNESYSLASWLLVLIGSVVTILLFRVLFFQLAGKKELFPLVGICQGIIWVILSVFPDRLRNTPYFLAWMTIALVNAIMGLLLDHSYLTIQDKYQEAITLVPLFFIPVAMLIVYQICRLLSLWFYKGELYLFAVYGYIPSLNRKQNGLELLCWCCLFIMLPAFVIWNSYV